MDYRYLHLSSYGVLYLLFPAPLKTKAHLSTMTGIILRPAGMCVMDTVLSLKVELRIWQILSAQALDEEYTERLFNILNKFRCHDFLNSATCQQTYKIQLIIMKIWLHITFKGRDPAYLIFISQIMKEQCQIHSKNKTFTIFIYSTVVSLFKNSKPLKVESVCVPRVERSVRQKLRGDFLLKVRI